MPEETGVWTYQIELGGKIREGEFECIESTGNNYGIVKAKGFHFQYADGSKYISIGTTCYAWINQPKELREQTLETLKESSFNKIRIKSTTNILFSTTNIT